MSRNPLWRHKDPLSSKLVRATILKQLKPLVGEGWPTVMRAANTIMDGHGIEKTSLRSRNGEWRTIFYVNMGDPYDTTLIYFPSSRSFRWGTWGGWVESMERRGFR